MAAMPVRRLVDFPYVLVRLRCDVCKRAGAYRLARLAVKYGAEILLDDLIVRLSSDCATSRADRAARASPICRRRSRPICRPRCCACAWSKAGRAEGCYRPSRAHEGKRGMEIENEEPPCAGQWFSFWVAGAKGKTKIEAHVDAKRIFATECPDHPCHALIQIPDGVENRTLRISATDSGGTACETRLPIQAGKPRPELTALTPENVQAADVARLPFMTRWF